MNVQAPQFSWDKRIQMVWQLYYITIEILTPSQTKVLGKKKATIYPIEQGKSNTGFSETDSLSWKFKKKKKLKKERKGTFLKDSSALTGTKQSSHEPFPRTFINKPSYQRWLSSFLNHFPCIWARRTTYRLFLSFFFYPIAYFPETESQFVFNSLQKAKWQSLYIAN